MQDARDARMCFRLLQDMEHQAAYDGNVASVVFRIIDMAIGFRWDAGLGKVGTRRLSQDLLLFHSDASKGLGLRKEQFQVDR